MDIRKLDLKWKLAAAGVAVMILGVLALRYAGEILAPFIDAPSSPRDSVAAAMPSPDSGSVSLASSDSSGMVRRIGPMVVDGKTYTVEIDRDTGSVKPPEASRQARVIDATGRLVYDENLFLRRDSTSSEEWLVFTPTVIEDEAGRSRGFQFAYAWFPSAAGTGVAFQVAAPRGDSLVVLTPTLIGYYGVAAGLLPGNAPQSVRLMPGNQMTIESARGWFDASIPLRINFDCIPKSEGCIRIDLKDSVAGLARFPVRVGTRQAQDTSVAIEVYSAPHGNLERIVIPPGQQAEILGGAAKVYFDRTPSLFLSAEDEWLEIRINGKRGWITGVEAFRAIGLQQGS